MPKRKHLRGASKKEQRQYEHQGEGSEIGPVRKASERSCRSDGDETPQEESF
jgi:hypothetical protein